MKKKLVLVLIAVTIVSGFYFNFQKSEAEKLREKHEAYLKQTPYSKTGKLSRKKRKSLGLPPNAYNEQMWHYTLDPNTGRPMPEKAFKIQQTLKAKRKGLSAKTPGDATNEWIDRGPNNLGGRTRGIMFDPNDSENKRVFAGGVSGGLWVNEDITNANSSWTLVPGIGANISVTVIIHDPNNTNIFYIGSGESYTSGNAIGRGIWRSIDGGVTWNIVFGGGADGTFRSGNSVVNGIFYVNDIVTRDNAGITEIYAAIAGGFYRDAGNPSQFTGIDQQGLYKSVDSGNNWGRLDIMDTANTFVNPNDLEIDLENNIWLATTRNPFGTAGGKIFKSIDGTDFTLINTLPSAARTEIEVSSLDANKLWAVVNDANSGQVANIYGTTDGFENFTRLNEPNDADEDISETDYTRGQAFYNLPIEVDVNDNLFVGGIDLFRSTDNGTTWTQLSKWSNNNELRNLNVPLVHADQHAVVFRPGTTSEVVFGNDGGVYYTDNILKDITTFNISERNLNYNVTQFYYGTIDNSGIENGDGIAGGTQDNGTPISVNSQNNVNSFREPFGGDGGYTEIDDSGQYMIQSYPRNTHNYSNYPTITFANLLTTSKNDDDEFLGSFINCVVLDKNLDILYSNATLNNDFKIERVRGFLPGETEEAIFLSDDVLDGNPSTMQISPFTVNSSRIFLGLENSKLIKVDNANTETPVFTNISGNNFVGSLSDIEFGTNEEEIFVTVHNFGVESIWFTNNRGTSWRSLEGNLPDLPVKCILQNPLNTNELIIGTELGIWKTDDYTITEPIWEQSFNGMSDVTVVDLDLRTTDNTILATTHGRGLFTSQFTDGTASINDVLSDKILFTVYPTVSNGNFTIFGKIKMDKTSIQIVSITGKKVFSGSLDFSRNMKQLVSLNVNSGVYIINLKTSNGNQFSDKIIIK